MAAEKIDALELNIESKLSVENLDKLIESLKKLGNPVKPHYNCRCWIEPLLEKGNNGK